MKLSLGLFYYAFLVGGFILSIYAGIKTARQNRLIKKDEGELKELSREFNFKIYKRKFLWQRPVAYERLSASLQLAFRSGTGLKSFIEGTGWMCAIINTSGPDEHYKEGKRPFTVFMRILNHLSPHLYFDNKQNGNAFKKELPKMLGNAALVNYEAFVHDKFRLYAPQGYHLDALVIGAPDLLDVIVNENHGADIEVLGNQLYLIFPSQIDLSDNIETLIKASDKIAKAIDDNLSRYQDDRAISKAEPIGHSGKRLTKY